MTVWCPLVSPVRTPPRARLRLMVGLRHPGRGSAWGWPSIPPIPGALPAGEHLNYFRFAFSIHRPVCVRRYLGHWARVHCRQISRLLDRLRGLLSMRPGFVDILEVCEKPASGILANRPGTLQGPAWPLSRLLYLAVDGQVPTCLSVCSSSGPRTSSDPHRTFYAFSFFVKGDSGRTCSAQLTSGSLPATWASITLASE